MRTFRVTALAAAAALALSMPVLAAQAKTAGKTAKAKTMTVSGTLQKGTYCVAVYDSGDVTSNPVDYTVSVTEE